jgi:hypothetical protein
MAGAVIGGTVSNAWHGLKDGLSSGSNYDGGQDGDDSNVIVVTYPYPASGQSSGYAPSSQNQNGPQWQNPPQPQASRPIPPEQQNQPVQPNSQNQQTQPSPQAFPISESPPTKSTQGNPPLKETSANPAASLSITLSTPSLCRKYPDTITSTTQTQTTYPGGSKLLVNCWTTASMPGTAGRIENSPIWLLTDRGCYISETATDESVDFQTKLPFCVSPAHWAGTVQKQYETKLDCYQCPTLKCPSSSIGKSKMVDVQCLVDGEVARGNNTWVKPVERNCYLPAEIFVKEGWMGELHYSCLSRKEIC